MIPPDLIPVLRAIQAGDKARARRLLSDMLKIYPTAEAWYLASQVTETTAHEIKCLQRALVIDPYHVEARRRLSRLAMGTAGPLEGAASGSAASTETSPLPPPRQLAPDVLKPKKLSTQLTPALKPEDEQTPDLKPVRRRKKRGTWFYLGLASTLLLSLTSVYFVMTVLGSSVPGSILGFFTGDQPITEIDGVPIEEVEDAVKLVEPSTTTPLRRSSPVSDALTPGYAHEYDFEVSRGEEIAIGVQFFSPTAQNVSRNVAIFDANGRDASGHCQEETIIDAHSGSAYICQIHVGGIWRLRILGREGESTGAYIVTMERFD